MPALELFFVLVQIQIQSSSSGGQKTLSAKIFLAEKIIFNVI